MAPKNKLLIFAVEVQWNNCSFVWIAVISLHLNYNAINVIIEEEICKMYILMQHKKWNITDANIECKNYKKNIYFSSFFENLCLW